VFIYGIDVGKSNYHIALLNDNELVKTFKIGINELETNFKPDAVGIDAPLSFPLRGTLRECERKLIKKGVLLFPSGANFFKEIVKNGIKAAAFFKNLGSDVFEVYPYATRVALNIVPQEKKRSRSGKLKIILQLKKYVRNISEKLTHDEVDAIISALTVLLFYKGLAEFIRGIDGEILIPCTQRSHQVLEL